MVVKKILIVDDEEIIRTVYGEILERSGYTTFLAEDAEKAQDLLNHQADIPVMFLDLKLPGMDGVSLCKLIRKLYPDRIIYAMTGYSSIFEHADCLTVGFNDYFRKPINQYVLLKAAEDAFDKLGNHDIES